MSLQVSSWLRHGNSQKGSSSHLVVEVWKFFSRMGETRIGWSISLDELSNVAAAASGNSSTLSRSPSGIALAALHELLWKARAAPATQTAAVQLLSTCLASPAARPSNRDCGDAMAGPRRLRAVRNFLGLAFVLGGVLSAKELKVCWDGVSSSFEPGIFDMVALRRCAQVVLMGMRVRDWGAGGRRV